MKAPAQPDDRKLMDLAVAVVIVLVAFASAVLFFVRAPDNEDKGPQTTTVQQQKDSDRAPQPAAPAR